MPGTRSSARIAANGSSPSSSQDKDTSNTNAGSKRKADAGGSPKSKRGRKAQKTLEETMPEGDVAENSEHSEEKATGTNAEGIEEQSKGIKSKSSHDAILPFGHCFISGAKFVLTSHR